MVEAIRKFYRINKMFPFGRGNYVYPDAKERINDTIEKMEEAYEKADDDEKESFGIDGDDVVDVQRFRTKFKDVNGFKAWRYDNHPWMD